MRLKKARIAARLSQEALGARAGVDHTTIARLELAPDRYLRSEYRTVVNLARALRAEPLSLFPVPAPDSKLFP